MSGRRDLSLIIEDMIEAARRMIDYAHGTPPESIDLHREKADAILFNLAVLGEAAKSVPPEIRRKRPDVPWAEMAMTRDKVIHHYHGIDWRTVSDIIEHKLPDLILRLESLLEDNRVQ